MLDLFGEVPVLQTQREPRRNSTPKRPEQVDIGGLFPLTDSLSPERFTAVFHSGATAYYDALAPMALHKDIGIVADRLVPRVECLVRDYVLKGGAVFVDSGAYSAYKKWQEGKATSPLADFDTVLNTYDRLIADLPPGFASGFAFVMPDVLKQPERSLALLEKYRERILHLIDAGVNAIVPLQRGAQSAGQTAQQVFSILGTRNITLGIPSAAAAMSCADAATIRGHDRFHILGRASFGAKLYQRCYAVLEHNPGSTISCDANLLRKRTDELTELHHGLIDLVGDHVWQGAFEETELIYQVINEPGWMSRPQIKALAHFYGIRDAAVVNSWIRAHDERDDGLCSVLNTVDPEANLLWTFGLHDVFFSYAKEEMSALLRAHAVAELLSTDASGDDSQNPFTLPLDCDSDDEAQNEADFTSETELAEAA
ncbi:hypothetical protein [Noviherbaspirillum pedocola]|uniref:Uncharacterized protein n=1 Tax=Noviherbaspirillum pedocola TaxID=2801341 RepID=A0A934T101_9BURK|nr:hypothetical protein [Noviherbaspirillum pedocola]MBK4738741.1 hypothetical protein [Noviherbaspirillum pedocola]